MREIRERAQVYLNRQNDSDLCAEALTGKANQTINLIFQKIPFGLKALFI